MNFGEVEGLFWDGPCGPCSASNNLLGLNPTFEDLDDCRIPDSTMSIDMYVYIYKDLKTGSSI